MCGPFPVLLKWANVLWLWWAIWPTAPSIADRLIGGTLGTLSLVMVVNLLLSFFQADNDYLREVFWKDLLGFIPVLLLFFGLIYASRVIPSPSQWKGSSCGGA
jgi:cadmium resistance protein CadD (predicted permease)